MRALRRIAWGASLCPRLLRAVWHDPPLRRCYLRVLGAQVAVTLLAALLWLVVNGTLDR